MATETPRSYFSHLECPVCGQHYSGREPVNFCSCGRPLLARYDLASVARYVRRGDYVRRPYNLWRYRELLPVLDEANIVTLGEGGTPLLPLRRLGAQLGLRHLFLKEEGYNPTGTFKATGLAVAVSKAKELALRAHAMGTA